MNIAVHYQAAAGESAGAMGLQIGIKAHRIAILLRQGEVASKAMERRTLSQRDR